MPLDLTQTGQYPVKDLVGNNVIRLLGSGNSTRINVSQNEWENKLVPMKADKVYKVTFRNLDVRNYPQFRVPFNYANALAECKPESEVVVEINDACEVYIQKFAFENQFEDSTTRNKVRFELKFSDGVTRPENEPLTSTRGIITTFSYASFQPNAPPPVQQANYVNPRPGSHPAWVDEAVPLPTNALTNQNNKGFYKLIGTGDETAANYGDRASIDDTNTMARLIVPSELRYNADLIGSLDDGVIVTGRILTTTEDLNGNGVLDTGEDINSDGSLQTTLGTPTLWMIPDFEPQIIDIKGSLPQSYDECFRFSAPTVVPGVPEAPSDAVNGCSVWLEGVNMEIRGLGNPALHMRITHSTLGSYTAQGADPAVSNGPNTTNEGRIPYEPGSDTYTSKWQKRRIHDLILLQVSGGPSPPNDANNDGQPSRYVGRQPTSTTTNRQYRLFDLTDSASDPIWFTRARQFNYSITGYYDNSGNYQHFTNPVLVTKQLTGLQTNQAGCVPDDPPDCDLPPQGLGQYDFDVGTVNASGSNNYNRTEAQSYSSSKITGSSSYYHTHPQQSCSTTCSPIPPYNCTTTCTPLPPLIHSGSYNTVGPATDGVNVTFRSFNNSAFNNTWLTTNQTFQKLILSGGLDYSDTSTSETNDSSHPVKLQVDFDLSDIDALITIPSSYVVHNSDNPTMGVYPSRSFNKTLTLTAHKIQHPTTNSVYDSSSTNKSNGSVLELDDSSSRSNAEIVTYEWVIEWELELRETISYYYTYTSTSLNSSGSPPHYSNSSSTSSGTWSRTNTLTFTGEVATCSRTLIVKVPDCVVNLVDPPPGHPLSGRTQERIPPGNNLTNVYPVGHVNGRTTFTMTNAYNYFPIETDHSSNRPAYTVRRKGSTSTFNQPTFAQVGDDGLPSSSYIPFGDSQEFAELPVAVNLPGEFTVEWQPAWVTAARGVTVPNGTTPSWVGIEHESNECSGSSSTEIDIFVWADPPKCIVRRDVFERGDSTAFIEVVLENINIAQMNIQSISYHVTGSGGFTFNKTLTAGPIPGASGIAPGDTWGSLSIRDTLDSSIYNRDGEYDYEWRIVTNMGQERWTTLENTANQNSWFENPDERITTEGPDGGTPTGVTPLPCEEQIRVVVKPYFKVFHGDVGAGGYFGQAAKYDSCGEGDDTIIKTSSSSGIDGFILGHSSGTGPSNARGSSVKHGTQSYGIISGFYSASQRTAAPSALKGLSFSNTNNAHDYGGVFGEPSCVSNYWREVENIPEEPITSGTINLDLSQVIRNNDRKRYVLGAGQEMNLLSSSPLPDLKATLFIEGNGDLYIKEDIINESVAGWEDYSEIGYMLIVVQGNIYIDPAVNRIDAVLVAYPKHYDVNNISRALGGEIWTCYEPGINAASHYAACNSDLVVNGALIAQRVRLGRINYSVIEGLGSPEQAALVLANNTLDTVNRTTNRNRASEEINLRPEFLIGIPELPIFADQAYKADSVTITPVNY